MRTYNPERMNFLKFGKHIAGAALIALAVTGCAENSIRDNALHTTGFVIGGMAGGYLGAQYGSGVVQLAYIGLGTALGGAGGVAAASYIAGSDLVFYQNATSQSLASVEPGKVVSWTNPESGNSGMIRTTNDAVVTNGMTCRPYRSTLALKNSIQSSDGTACQTADGQWQIVSDSFL